MKTIATAAILMMLAAPAWADEQSKSEANDPATTNEPIVLSEAEMDGVTAGYELHVRDFSVYDDDPNTSTGVQDIHTMLPWKVKADMH